MTWLGGSWKAGGTSKLQLLYKTIVVLVVYFTLATSHYRHCGLDPQSHGASSEEGVPGQARNDGVKKCWW